MQISPQQLKTMLTKPVNQCPVNVIWLEGKETLLVQQARDSLLQWAKQTIAHRQLHHVDQNFDWQALMAENASFGLFDEEKIYDLRIVRPTLKAADIAAILALTKVIDQQKIVIISSDKLDKKTTQTAIFKKLQGFIGQMTFWPLSSKDYPRWIEQYAKTLQLQLEKNTIDWLASQHEGHLLALQQCLKRISFTCHAVDRPYTIADIQGSTLFQAQYTTFDAADLALTGQTLKSIKALQQLKTQGQEPILLLWAINNLFESLQAYQHRLQQGQSMPWPQYKIFGPRIKLIERAAQRLTPSQIQSGLGFCGLIDQMIKGLIAYDVWLALIDALVLMSEPDSSLLTLTQSASFEEFCTI